MKRHDIAPEVLIVDDDEGICHLITEALARENIPSVSAHTGADALCVLDRHGPVLTLLDLKLPDMDGREIARILSERQPRVPFIVISGLSNTQVAVDLMKLGAVDFLIKDLGFLTLIPAAVRRALDARDREQKLREAEEARRQLEESIIEISEIERRRIGHDLHDDICQRLAAIKLKCEKLAHQLKKQNLSGAEAASEVSSEIATTTSLARGLARGLSPVDVEADGFTDAVARLCSMSEKLHEIPVIFHCPQSVRLASGTSATHLYRIVQELVTNAARHGVPSQIDVTLMEEGDYVRLEVVNDGRAFAGPEGTSTGMGLRIMRYRAGVIGARLEIGALPPPRSGTRAVCLVPRAFFKPEPVS